MAFASLLRQQLEVLRYGVTASIDEWGQPALTDPTVVATIPGRVAPISSVEAGHLADIGVANITARCFLLPNAEVVVGDRIQTVDSGQAYWIRNINRIQGRDAVHHLELDLERLVEAVAAP